MDSIKKFFEKKKKDIKFKHVGEGKQLSSASRPRNQGSKMVSRSKVSSTKSGPSSESKKAGAAALARFETQGPRDVDWSLQAIRAQAKREMETEKNLALMDLEEKSGENAKPKKTVLEAAPMLAVQGVYFYSSILGPQVESYNIIKGKICEFLYGQLGEDQAVASCLIIHTSNRKDKVTVCVETLCKYIDNILANPQDEKYRKIRKSNRAFQDRVACIEGTKEFLQAAGFETRELPFNDNTDQFWVFPEDKLSELGDLENIRNALISAEPLKPQLDRSLRVLLPKEAAALSDLPPEFFAMTSEEIRNEQQGRTEIVERNQMLMTKAMREKMQMREIRKYRFTLIRIRFADGIILQGTFGIYEKFATILEFVRENLTNSWRPFFLSLSGGGKVTEEESSLAELRLVPAVLLNFQWDMSIQDPDLDDSEFLTDDVMMMLQDAS